MLDTGTYVVQQCIININSTSYAMTYMIYMYLVLYYSLRYLLVPCTSYLVRMTYDIITATAVLRRSRVRSQERPVAVLLAVLSDVPGFLCGTLPRSRPIQKIKNVHDNVQIVQLVAGQLGRPRATF